MSLFSKFLIWNGMLVWLGSMYYGPQWWPLFGPYELVPGPLDRVIPFLPATAWIYQSLFLLVPLAALIQPTTETFARFTLFFCLLVLSFSAIFWLCPTELQAPPASVPASWSYNYLVADIDGRKNSFPSQHAALTLYAGLAILRQIPTRRLMRYGVIVWMTILLASMLTTKQHICIDLVAGGLLGALFAHFARVKTSVDSLAAIPTVGDDPLLKRSP